MRLSAILVAFLVAPADAQIAALVRIGVAGAVNGKVEVFSAAPQPIGRVIGSGKPLYLNERVKTGSDGRLQIMLLDETVFTIGPKSEMALNEFVYDPKSGAGKVTAKVTQGVFRFVTGKIGHNQPSDMKVEFPVGTMGIRGTIVGGKVEEDGSTLAVLLGPGASNNAGERSGAFSLSNAGQTVDVNKAGFGSRITGPNNPPTAPAMVSPIELGSIMGVLAPESKGSNGKEPESSQSSNPNQAAGQDVAGARGDLSSIATIGETSSNSNSTTNLASQESTKASGLPDVVSTWDQVRAIPSGTGSFSSSGQMATACSGCQPGPQPIDFVVRVDFGLKTIGGSFNDSSIHIHNVVSSGDDLSTTVNSINFSALGGNASIALSNSGGSLSDPRFDGTKLSLINANGVAAAQAKVDLKFVDVGVSASGSMSGAFTASPPPIHGQ